jgi:hypothetical protein
MTFAETIKNKLNDQDFNQKMNTTITVCIELYKVMVSSLLILFVPQKCDDHVCTYSENMVVDNHLYTGGLIINFITLLVFAMLYAVEIKRENKLITYLEVNTEKAFDNHSVGQALNHLSLERRKSIMYLDKMYQMIGKTTVVMFVSNTILSGIVIYNYYLDNQTTSTYITNILFMSTKIYDVYSNSTSDENIFYSAYLKTKVQYNDVDPNKFIEFTSIDEDIEKSEHDEPITQNVEEIIAIEAKDPNEIVPLDDDLKEPTIEQPIENS